MSKTVAVISFTGSTTEIPAAPYLIQNTLASSFHCHVVSRQTDPEPTKFQYYSQLLRTCLFRKTDIVHTFNLLGALLVLIRRIWDAGPYWIHSPIKYQNPILQWVNQRMIAPQADQIYIPNTYTNGSFAAALEDATEEIEKLKKLYQENSRTGIVVISEYATHNQANSSDQFRLLSKYLGSDKYRVYLLQRFDPDLNLDLLKSRWGDVHVIRTLPSIPNGQNNKLIAGINDFLFFSSGLAQLIRYRNRVKILQAIQLFLPTTLGIAARVLLRKPLVVKVTQSGHQGEKRALATLPLYGFRVRGFSKIDRVIVLNQEMSSEMRELGFEEDKLNLIPNSIEVSESSVERTFETPGFHILYCGPMIAESGIENILDSAHLLAKKGYQLEISFIGGRNNQRDVGPKVKAMAYSLRKSVTTHFYGQQMNLKPFLSKADCLVVPAKSLNFNELLLEAQVCGTPCIVSDMLSHRFLIEDRVNGLLYRNGNPMDLARKIEELILDKTTNQSKLLKSLSNSSQELVRNRFSSSNVSQQLLQLYDSLLELPIKQ